jgi:hypothetical protein
MVPRRSACALVAAAAALVAAGGAPARVYPLSAVPLDIHHVDGEDVAPLAVDDGGRVAFAAQTDWDHVAAGVRAPGRPAVIAPLPGMAQVGAATLAPGGELVVAGDAFTGESARYADDPHSSACCYRPTLARWRPGAPKPTVIPIAPDRHRDIDVYGVISDRAGTAYIVESASPDYASDGFTMLQRVPRAGATTARRVPAREGTPGAFDLRLGPGDLGATAIVTDDDARTHRLAIGPADDTWHQSGPPTRIPPFDSDVALAPDDGMVTAYVKDGRLWLRRGSGLPRALARARASRDSWRLAVGRDGTIGLLWTTHGHVVRLRTVDPGGHVHRTRTLGDGWRAGRSLVELELRVDDSGHAHALFQTAPDAFTVAGPAGRATLRRAGRRLSLRGYAISPGGAEAVAVANSPRTLLWVRTP